MFLIGQVSAQGRFLEDLLKYRTDSSVLTDEAIQHLLEDLAARVFAQHDTNDVETWSNIFLVQENHPRFPLINKTLADDPEIEFRTYDFTHSAEDKGGIGQVGELFKEDVKYLENQRETFKTGETVKDPLEVDTEHVRRMLSSVLTLPRNHVTDQVKIMRLEF